MGHSRENWRGGGAVVSGGGQPKIFELKGGGASQKLKAEEDLYR